MPKASSGKPLLGKCMLVSSKWIIIEALLVRLTDGSSRSLDFPRMLHSDESRVLTHQPRDFEGMQVTSSDVSTPLDNHPRVPCLSHPGPLAVSIMPEVCHESTFPDRERRMVDHSESFCESVPSPTMVTPSSPLAFGFTLKPACIDYSKPFELRTLLTTLELKAHPFESSWLKRDESFNRILNTEINRFREEKYASIRTTNSPSLSYLAVFLSQCMAEKSDNQSEQWMHQHFRTSGKTLGFSYEFFLPFTYQLLLMKPSECYWKHFEEIFTAFCVRWKSLIFQEKTLRLEDFEKFEEAIAEKTAKMFQWISEFLISSYVPELMEKGKLQWEKQRSIKCVEKKKKLTKLHPVANFFKILGLSHFGDRAAKAKSKRVLLAYLVEQWQSDCHNGYPVRTETESVKGFLKTYSRVSNPESQLSVWKNWCNSSLMIEKSAEKFQHHIQTSIKWDICSLKSAAVISQQELLISLVENNHKILSKEKTCFMFSAINLNPSSVHQFIESPLPLETIIEPIGTCDSLEKLSFFLNSKGGYVQLQYLADKLETFFKLDFLLGESIRHFHCNFQNDQYQKKRCAINALRCSNRKKHSTQKDDI